MRKHIRSSYCIQSSIQHLSSSEARRKNALLSSGNELLSPLRPRRLPPGKIELPEPPALLPKTIAGLVRLETPQISALLKEYEIEECKATPAASPLSPGGAVREANLDRLMVFLGVSRLPRNCVHLTHI